MKTFLYLIGKTENPNLYSEINKYFNRIKHYMPIEIKIIPEGKNKKNITSKQQKEEEGEAFLKQISKSDKVILLDEHGREYRSIDFSKWLQQRQIESQNLCFFIGGPYGFSEKVYERADMQISLSKMTFPHDMVRLFFLEQLYRACSILRGEPYHHE